MHTKGINASDKLRKLYESKCSQAEKAKQANNAFQYMVLKAEADAIKQELGDTVEE